MANDFRIDRYAAGPDTRISSFGFISVEEEVVKKTYNPFARWRSNPAPASLDKGLKTLWSTGGLSDADLGIDSRRLALGSDASSFPLGWWLGTA